MGGNQLPKRSALCIEMDDLFSQKPIAPLAEQLRPTSLNEVIGQEHLLGLGKPIRNAFEAQELHSFVLWGPPGVGKTTLGRLTAKAMNCEFLQLSAVMAGVKEIREVEEAAERNWNNRGRRTIVFIDEIHRFNKAQQDALLGNLERGAFILISGTTENPSFSLNAALLSRLTVYVMNRLSDENFAEMYKRVRPSLGGVELDDAALSMVTGFADGDGRRFINILENLLTAAKLQKVRVLNAEFVKTNSSAALRQYDKNGEHHYNLISALHKSVRGSNPDAALYWLARMLAGGANPLYIARRVVRMASEEIGVADPRALPLAIAAAETYERLGSPEGELALAHAIVHLCMAPKSNAVYTAWNRARAYVATDVSREVPMHLRNAPTELMTDLGYHAGYRYAHDEPGAYAAGEYYFPEDMAEPQWYEPTNRGLEGKIGERLRELRQLDATAIKEGRGRKRQRPRFA